MKNWIKRSARTFVQTAVGYAATTVTTYYSGAVNLSDVSAIKSAVIGVVVSAIAAGIAAVMNFNEGK